MTATTNEQIPKQSIFDTLSKPLLKHPKLFSLILGVLLPFGFAPFGFYIVSLVSVLGAIFVWRYQNVRTAAQCGFLYGFSAFLVGAYWVTISVGTFGGAPVWLAMLVMLGLVAIMAFYFAVLAYFIAKFSKRISSNLLWALSITSLWTLMEWFRSWVLTGFPWLNLGYLSLDTPMAGYAPLGGVYFCTFLWVLCVTFLLNFQKVDKTQKIITLVFVLSILCSGAIFIKHNYTQNYQDIKSVALIQGGVSQDKKWLAEQLPKTMELYAQLSVENSDADILVWPEVAIPTLRANVVPYFNGLRSRLGADTDFLVGALERKINAEGQREDFNALFLVDEKFNTSQEQAYFKNHLVPYGEYFPLPNFMRQMLCQMNLPCSNITAGVKKQNPSQYSGEYNK